MTPSRLALDGPRPLLRAGPDEQGNRHGDAASVRAPSSQPSGEIYADLKRRILAVELRPGSPVSRAGLQAHYGLSSTPVRDALLKLRDEALVTMRPQSRTLVSHIDLDQARQAQVLRSAVEQDVAARLAGQAPPRLVETLETILHLQEARVAQRDLAAFQALDLTFHRSLFEAADLVGLFAVIRRESIHIDRLRALHLPLEDKAERILADHRAILDAIARKAPQDARAAMEGHLSSSIAMGPALRAEHPDYFRT